MYLKNILIKNIGPLDEININLPFNEDESPKPIVFVGENGTGKTMLLSPIVDALYEFANNLFPDDVLPKQGAGYKYYKVSGTQLKIGHEQGLSALIFKQDENQYEYLDVAVPNIKKEIITDKLPDFKLTPQNDNIHKQISTNLNLTEQKAKLQNEFLSGCYFYLPAYRYEKPFWVSDSFDSQSKFKEATRFTNQLGKEIEILSSWKENKTYLLDFVLDFVAFRREHDTIKWTQLNEIIKKIKQKNTIQFGIGPRSGYRVSIIEYDESGKQKAILLPSVDNLSLGEILVLNMFLNILRHSDNPPKEFNEITGIVLIDEIDSHLHTNLQKDILPELIKLFPKIQFIITTHSPFFILGMEKTFKKDGLEIRKLPDGDEISAEKFSEFEKAYQVICETEKHEEELKKYLQSNSAKPIIFVEGDYDIRYLNKAAELLEKQEMIKQVKLENGDGFGNLDKVWKHFDSKLCKITPQKILLLYDCEMNKPETKKGNVVKKNIPIIENNPIEKGIENLLSKATIDKAMEANSKFVDITPETTKIERGNSKIIPEKLEVNKDEKSNLCNWICTNCTKEDFESFSTVFLIIENFISIIEESN